MKPIRIDGVDYLLVKTTSWHEGSCKQCVFDQSKTDRCPHIGRDIACIPYEIEIKSSAHIIKDTPEDIAKYIATMLSPE